MDKKELRELLEDSYYKDIDRRDGDPSFEEAMQKVGERLKHKGYWRKSSVIIWTIVVLALFGLPYILGHYVFGFIP